MDIDAIARKWLEQRGVDLAMEGPATARCIMDGAKMTIEGVLAAAGVPEMEKRLEALERELAVVAEAVAALKRCSIVECEGPCLDTVGYDCPLNRLKALDTAIGGEETSSRMEELEAQCAAMREALEMVIADPNLLSCGACGPGNPRECNTAPSECVKREPWYKIQVALSSTAGRDFLARLRAAEKVCGAAIVVRDEFCFGCGGPRIVECKKCEINQILDALREWEGVRG